MHSGQLLRDIEAISRALYLQKPRSDVRSKSVGKTRATGSKPRISDEHHHFNEKNSVWNWKKSLKSLAHIGHKRFDVCFFLHVHSIEGLPLGFNDLSLSVHWKRKDHVVSSRPSRVMRGVAEFDEALMHRCYVYGSRTGPQNSAKYDGKLFMIYVSVTGTLDIDFGKRWVDLTKLLPCTLEELETEKNSGKWTTSFGLAGKAKGATLNVSFGFSLERDRNSVSQVNQTSSVLDHLTPNFPRNTEARMRFAASMRDEIHCVRSIPHSMNHENPLCFQSVDVKKFDEVPQNVGLELSKSIKFLYQKLNEVNLHNSDDLDALAAHLWLENSNVGLDLDRSSSKDGCDDEFEFTIIDQGIEMPEKFESEIMRTCPSDVGLDGSVIETIDINEIIMDDDESLAAQKMSHVQEIVDDIGSLLVAPSEDEKKTRSVYGSSSEDPEAACLVPGDYAVESPLSLNYFTEHENYMEMKSDCATHSSVKRSLSLDEVTESVANDFLNMLGSDGGSFRINSDCIAESPRELLLREFEKDALSCGDFILDCNLSRDDGRSAYVGEVGSSYGSICQDFDRPLSIRTLRKEQPLAIELPSRRTTVRVLEDMETEALMREWGLNEDAFQSSPHDYSGGFGSPIEVACGKAFELPPLGDGFGPLLRIRNGGYLRSTSSIYGHSKNVRNLIIQISPQVVLPATMGCDILEILQHLASVGTEKLSSQTKRLMPLQDLTGQSLDQIVLAPTHSAASTHRFDSPSLYSNVCDSEMASEYVSLEDLVPLALDKIEVLSIQGLRIQSGMSDEMAPETICPPQSGRELQVLDDIRENSSAAVGLLDLSLTLDEWLRIDAGMSNEGKVSQQATSVLRAHQAKPINIVSDILGGGSPVRYGVLGNNLTVAFMIQLRDPLRDCEPVGALMLALIQAQREFLHLDMPEEGPIGFKICDVHVSGLNTDPGRTQLWGTKAQQQSGVRWLLASGLSKSHKYPVSNSKAIVLSHPQQNSKVATGDILWSISCGWEEGAGFTRNPDVEIPGQCH
ncbi:unnamed protein product [Linum tenue]|uniref:C2 NT-type domain-containing protein n=1 Tax=Linum tenue TaxID=586396 RepID=A0AAV0IUQ4_9ROSI|nr:unnamed protein product [Linum tenue]